MGAVTKKMGNQKLSLNVSNSPLLSACSGTSTRGNATPAVTAWVKKLPEVVSALNNEVTSLTCKKPAVAIKEKAVAAKAWTPYSKPVGQRENNSPPLLMSAICVTQVSLKGV